MRGADSDLRRFEISSQDMEMVEEEKRVLYVRFDVNARGGRVPLPEKNGYGNLHGKSYTDLRMM